MKRTLYHQIENTNESELSTYLCDCNTWEFNTPHFHKNMELLLCVEGTCHCTIGAKSYLLRQGEALLIFPYQIHAFSLGERSLLRCVTFSALLILTLARALEGKSVRTPVFHPSRETAEYFLSEMLRLVGRRSDHNRYLPKQVRMKIKGLLYLIGSEFLAEAELLPDSIGTTFATDLIQYLSENYTKNISLHEIADRMGYNYQYFSRTFNRVFGMNFKKLLNCYRMDRAYELLRDTDLSIAEIAYESGFQSLRSFDQYCHEVYGVSPREIRKEEYT